MLKDIADKTYEAGEILKSLFGKKSLKIFTKSDKSPVTEADHRVSDYFIEALKGYGLPVVTEERILEVPADQDYFIIDPLDGTRYFIDQQDCYAILVALVSKNQPTLGVTYFPSLDLMYTAKKGGGAFLNSEKIFNAETRSDLVAFSAGFHRKPEALEIIENLNIKSVLEQESVLKMTRLAQGVADFYPRFGRTYEWDTASAQILLEEAGCCVYDVTTQTSLQYSKPHYKNNGFVVFRRDLKDKVCEALKVYQKTRTQNV